MMHMLKQGVMHTLLKAAEAGDVWSAWGCARGCGLPAHAAASARSPPSPHRRPALHASTAPAGTVDPHTAALALAYGLQCSLGAVAATAGVLQTAEEPHGFWAGVLSGQSTVGAVQPGPGPAPCGRAAVRCCLI